MAAGSSKPRRQAALFINHFTEFIACYFHIFYPSCHHSTQDGQDTQDHPQDHQELPAPLLLASSLFINLQGLQRRARQVAPSHRPITMSTWSSSSLGPSTCRQISFFFPRVLFSNGVDPFCSVDIIFSFTSWLCQVALLCQDDLY